VSRTFKSPKKILTKILPAFECDVCQKRFVRNEHLKKHKDSQHNKDADGNDLVKKEYCPVCNKGFRTPKYLQIHMKSHSAEPKNLTCKYCNLEFLDRASLNQHSKEIHAQFEKPFLCRYVWDLSDFL
jgi:uncharacterized Zn-finger protein